jgi:membrane dipeptidase
MTVDASALSASLGISREAGQLYLSCEVVDLHVDTFIWTRVFGYDLGKRHGTGPLRARIWGQADAPRVLDAQLAGAMWVITTNPLRTRAGRLSTLLDNVAQLTHTLERTGRIAVVKNMGEYEAARRAGKHAAFLGLQGGNALSRSLDDFDRPELATLWRITLLHFTRSRLGAPALPEALCWGDQGLTDYGRDYVRKLNEKRILVDLAHLAPEGFWQALEVHDHSLPLAVTHAACQSVFRHFRNLTDAQLRAVADTGGVVGVMFQSAFLGDRTLGGRAERVVDHLEHVIRTVGEDHAALGSDFDGAIMPPRDLKTVLELPRLVEIMLRRGFRDTTIRKVLGGNALRMLAALRP